MVGRLAVRDQDDLLVRALLEPEELAREQEARVHVGPDVPVAPGQARELLRLELARVERQADDGEPAARELATDERVAGERDLLGQQADASVEQSPARCSTSAISAL